MALGLEKVETGTHNATQIGEETRKASPDLEGDVASQG